MRPFGNAKQLEKRRKAAIELFNKGELTQAEVAKRFGVTLRAVQFWLQWHRGRGKRGIASQKTPGRPSKLDMRQQKKLVKIILAGAAKAGYSTDLWTCPRIQVIIRKEFHIIYHVDHIVKLLRKLGFTPQKPERRAIERNEKVIRNWVRQQWPRIKKKQ